MLRNWIKKVDFKNLINYVKNLKIKLYNLNFYNIKMIELLHGKRKYAQ